MEIKKQSLNKQHEIIGHALDIFCIESNENNRLSLKSDVLGLDRMLNEIKDSQRKTSRFNVFDKSKQTIAENVSFAQAKQYQNCIVNFLGMEA